MNHAEVADLIRVGLEQAASGSIKALATFRRVGRVLRVHDVVRQLSYSCRHATIEAVLVHPDGFLWNLPWAYLFRAAWREEVKTSDTDLPPVAVAIGTGESTTRVTADRAVFCGGWGYGCGTGGAEPRRGHRRDGALQNLPSVRVEIEKVATLWRARGRQCIEDSMCNATQLLSYVGELGAPAIVHIGCHGDVGNLGMPALLFPADSSERD